MYTYICVNVYIYIYTCIFKYIYIYIHISIFKVGLGIAPTNADSQQIPVYKAFHQICFCGNKMICR